jgi:hypothetical protein
VGDVRHSTVDTARFCTLGYQINTKYNHNEPRGKSLIVDTRRRFEGRTYFACHCPDLILRRS